MKSEEDSLVQDSGTLFPTFKSTLSELRNSEISLFLVFILNMLMSFQYYLLATLIPLYFTDSFDFSDILSGIIFGIFGLAIGLSSLFILYYEYSGFSLKLILVASALLGLIGFVLLCIDNVYTSLIAVIAFESVSCALAWPILEFAVSMYSSFKARKISSSIFFICNYISGIAAGIFIDIVWSDLKTEHTYYLIFFAVGIFSCLSSLAIIYFLRPVYVKSDGNFTDDIRNSSTFWRFFCFIIMMVLLRSSFFGHLDSTFPKYTIRTTDDESAHFGMLLAIHSVTIIFGIFVFTGLTFYYSSYSLIVIGAFIGIASGCILIFLDKFWGFVLAIIGISLGESIWVPRLLDYSYEVASKNAGSIYLALSNFPMYFGMIVTGLTSGVLLEEYCPEDGEQNCEFIWVIICACSIWIPIFLLVFRKYLEEPKALEEPKLLDEPHEE